MPSNEARALSLQAQYAGEVVLDNTARAVEALFAARATPGMTEPAKREFAALYVGIVLAGMHALSRVRAGYLAAFARAEGQPALTIPNGVWAPTFADVLTERANTEAAAFASLARLDQLTQQAQRAVESAEVRIPINLRERAVAASAVAREHAEGATLAAGDFADRAVLGPARTVVAFRRVIHPTACDRCRAVAGVLVFKDKPQPRHQQCRCSVEPVYITDADYQSKLARYRGNVEARGADYNAADTRRRGRSQLAEHELRQGLYQQQTWAQFMRDEQARLAKLVQTIPSNTYREWALMTNVRIAESGAEGLLPVISRK